MSLEHAPQREPRKRIRRSGLAKLFDVDIRTIDGWAKRGVISPPHYLPGSTIPFWFVDEIPEDKRKSGKAA
jgi:hypothetical protein